jgi:hypothetical protein
MFQERLEAIPRCRSTVGPRSGGVMEQHDFKERPYFVAVRTKLGEAFREKHDLMEPLAPGLLELLAQLDTSIHLRQTTESKLYAEIDECVAAMVGAGKRKPSKTGEA